MIDPFDLAMGAGFLLALYVIAKALMWALWPRKLKPDDWDDPSTWGSQDFDSRKRRKTRP